MEAAMSQRLLRGARFVAFVGLATALVAGIAFWTNGMARRRNNARAVAPFVGASSSIAELTAAMRRGDANALSILHQRLITPTPQSLKAMPDAEAGDWLDSMMAMRLTFGHCAPEAKIVTMQATARMLERLGVEPTPAGWTKFLTPSFEILSLGLIDKAINVRIAALTEVGRFWSWVPGSTMSPEDESTLALWKDGFQPSVVRLLGAGEPAIRASAVACLGNHPITDAAAPAVACITDKDLTVRFQVLKSFANRPALLETDAILPMLHDPLPELAGVAEHLLKGRRMTPEQIGLARRMYHPKADVRAASISLIVERTDIDPVISLLHFTDDKDANVRLKAVQALTGRITPEVQQRLRELAASDDSAAVRAAAVKLAPPESTASLPPLPGSPSLTPKAN
jgi:hypothetical protein